MKKRRRALSNLDWKEGKKLERAMTACYFGEVWLLFIGEQSNYLNADGWNIY